MRLSGILGIFVGIYFVLNASNMDITVERVYNIGLIADRNLEFGKGAVFLVIGSLFLGFDFVVSSHPGSKKHRREQRVLEDKEKRVQEKLLRRQVSYRRRIEKKQRGRIRRRVRAARYKLMWKSLICGVEKLPSQCDALAYRVAGEGNSLVHRFLQIVLCVVPLLLLVVLVWSGIQLLLTLV